MLGIIGGLGPKATAKFYSRLMDDVSHRANGSLPRLVMYNVPMSPRIENAFLSGDVGQQSPERLEVRNLLSEAVAFFCRNGVSAVVMPCNTLQEELAIICSEMRMTYIDMIDETVGAAFAAGMRRVLILGTSSTCQADVYGRRLREYQITRVYPEGGAQRAIERNIREALDRRTSISRQPLIDLVRGAALECDGIIIACTDISGCVSEIEVEKPIFDSLACLSRGAADWILGAPRRHLIDIPKMGERLATGVQCEGAVP